jgi:hypothetical protein
LEFIYKNGSLSSFWCQIYICVGGREEKKKAPERGSNIERAWKNRAEVRIGVRVKVRVKVKVRVRVRVRVRGWS